MHDLSLPPHEHNPPATTRVGLIATVGSVLSAFFGVQSARTRERDFTRGSPVLFFGVALGLTAGFALGLFALVHLVLGLSVP